MTVEIDETELANLRRIASVADLVAKHPKARGMMQEAVRVAAPDQAGPETILRNEFSEGLNAIRDELKADREAREKAAAERAEADSIASLRSRWETGRGRARASGYTDEGLEKLEKFMEERGVADHEIAIPAFERANPPPEPVVSGNQSWNFLGSPGEAAPDLKMLFDGDEEGFLRQAVPTALASVRNQR